jgi:hypothetical protein
MPEKLAKAVCHVPYDPKGETYSGAFPRKFACAATVGFIWFLTTE